MEKTIATAAAALPDDAIEEILQRVDDVATLFRCTATCKLWRALVSNPSFLRRRWPTIRPIRALSSASSLRRRSTVETGEQMFIPAQRSPLCRCSLSSFFPEGAAWLEGAELITSRRGLLLVLLYKWHHTGDIRLAVCNPLAGTCDVLPPLKRMDTFFDSEGCAILTGEDLSSNGRQQDPLPGYSTFFKVLIYVHRFVWENDSDRVSIGYELHMFSSNESSWTEHPECFNQLPVKALKMVGCAVVCQGTARWLVKSTSDFYALQVCADTGSVVSCTKLWLDSSYTPWFHVGTDGTPSLLVPRLSYRGNKIEVWTRRDDGDSAAEWLRTGIIKLQRPKLKQALTLLFRKINLQRPNKRKHKVGTLSGALLFVTGSGMHVVDLTTGATEDVTAQFRGLHGGDSVPFEVNWTDFFSSRLGMYWAELTWSNFIAVNCQTF